MGFGRLKFVRLIIAGAGIYLVLFSFGANAATWCDIFDQIMLELREHQFSCGNKVTFECFADDSEVNLPGVAFCRINSSAGLVDRSYRCEISQPTPKLESLWGHYIWHYFYFCASKGLLAAKGRIDRETTQPFFSYAAEDHLYTVELNEHGTEFLVTVRRAKQGVK